MRLTPPVLTCLLVASVADARPASECLTRADTLGELIAEVDAIGACGAPMYAYDIPPAEWTFFVHLNADNDLAPYALEDLAEMSRAGSSTGKVNVIALVDGPRSWGPPKMVWIAPAGSPCPIRELVVGDRIGEYLARGEVNMGDPAVLRAAIEWTRMAVPSRRFFLNLWDHGTGWRGISFDDGEGRDYLDFSRGELAAAIDGLPIDVLGADACLTATVEVAMAADRLSDHRVHALVASQEIEPGSGWEYDDLLRRLAANVRGGDQPIFEVVSQVVESYTGQGGQTLSAIDLHEYVYVENALNAFADALVEAGGLADNPELAEIYRSSIRFEDRDLMDLGYFARMVAVSFPPGKLRDRAKSLLGAIRSATVHATGAGARYSQVEGISIYAPLGTIDPMYLDPRAPWRVRDASAPGIETHRWVDFLRRPPRTGFVPPSWARMLAPGEISAADVVRPATPWTDRNRLPVAFTFVWVRADARGDPSVHYTGHMDGDLRATYQRVDPATRTIRIGVEVDERPGASHVDPGAHSHRFGGSGGWTVSPPPGATGDWTAILEYAPTGEELGRATWRAGGQ